MKIPDLFLTNEFADIPPQFHSDATGLLFNKCLVCDRYLLTPGTPYVIEKAVRNYPKFQTTDTIFEYAMCFECLEKHRETISELSRQRIDAYMAANVDLAQRRQRLVDAKNFEAKEWTANCLVKGTTAGLLDEYQVYCQCDGNKMLFTYMPFMISGPAMDEMMQLLSNQTLGEIGGFMNEYFGVPPELEISPIDRPVLIF